MTQIPDITEHLRTIDAFCHPDWEAIRSCFESELAEPEWHEGYLVAARLWLERVRHQLGGRYQLHETVNFMILTSADTVHAARMGDFVERARDAILRNLDGAALDQGYGKHVVLLLGEECDYFRYIAPFYPDGEHPAPGGLCLNHGYTHIVMHTPQFTSYRRCVVHEMTHVMLQHLPLPAWLNEALAMRMEEAVCREGPALDPGLILPGRQVWDEAKIQLFWRGDTWGMPDLFSDCYDLALLLWRKLEVGLGMPREVLLEFVAAADAADAGEGACQAVFDFSLGDLMEDHLGPGDWAPRPESWETDVGEQGLEQPG